MNFYKIKFISIKSLIVVFSLAYLATGCVGKDQQISISEVAFFKLPVFNLETQKYHFQSVPLAGVDSVKDFSGKYAQFFISPSSQNSKLTGAKPQTHFIKTKSNYVATNDLSLQVATIYSHLEGLYYLDKKLGVEGINKIPRDVGVAVNVKDGGQVIDNNAFYDGELDAFLFVPYTENNLPININAGIIAHEHFHSIFFKTVFQTLIQSGKFPMGVQPTAHSKAKIFSFFDIKDLQVAEDFISQAVDNETQVHSWYSQIVIRGLNEGLADFWGWLYTDDSDFISHSIPFLKNQRTLDGKLEEKYRSSKDLKIKIQSFLSRPKLIKEFAFDEIYKIGTYFARNLKAITLDLKNNKKISLDEAKVLVAKTVIKSLNPLLRAFEDNTNTNFYDLNDYLISVFDSLVEKTQTDCESFITKLNNAALDKYECKQENGVLKIVKAPTEDEE